LQALAEYDVFVCYCEETGITWAENVKRILERRGYRVYVAHLQRAVNMGNWQEFHNAVIRQCRIFLFINTLEALESDEIMREISIAFPDGDTSRHSFWIIRDRHNSALNSPVFQTRTGKDLSSQNQAPFSNESEFNTTIIRRCLDERRRAPEKLDAQVKPPEEAYLSIRLRFRNPETINQARINEIDDLVIQDKFHEALQKLEAILSQVSQPPSFVIYDRAWLLYKLDRNEEALDVLNGLLTKQPDDVNATHLKTLILQKRGNYYDALALYDRMLGLSRNNVRIMTGKAYALARIGEITQSINLFEEATRVDSNYPDAWYNLGILYFSQGRLLDALHAYQKATNLDPYNAKTFVNKGVTLRKLGRIDDAIASYEEAIKQEPNNPIPYQYKALAYAYKQDYTRSLTWFDKAIKRDPRYVDAWINRSVSFANLGNMNKALKDVRRARELRPEHPVAHFNEGTLLFELSSLKAAERSLREALRLKPDYIEAMVNLASLLIKLKKYEESVKLINKVIQQNPNDYEALYIRSTSLIRLGKYVDAVEDSNRATALNQHFAPAYYNKAWASALLGHEENMLESLERAIQLDDTARERARDEEAFRLPKIRTKLERLLG
jgi:tetratricopeptide (TPR) repeat protein